MFSRISRKIQEKLGLTKGEAGIILFLSLGLLLGGTVKLLHLDKATEKYDFADSDSFFASASSKIDSVLAYEEDTLANQTKQRTDGKKKELTSPVDINLASIDELMTLPGVGKVTANRIIEYRKSTGRFHSVVDLMKVKGIGKKKFEEIKPHVKAE